MNEDYVDQSDGGGMRTEGGLGFPPFRLLPTLFWHHHGFIWSAPRIESCGTWSTRCSPVTVLCRSDVVSRCSSWRLSKCEAGKLWNNQPALFFFVTIHVIFPRCPLIRRNPVCCFSSRLGNRKQHCHTCWGFWDFSFVFLVFLLSTLPCCWGGGRSRPCMSEDGGACGTVRWLWVEFRDEGW